MRSLLLFIFIISHIAATAQEGSTKPDSTNIYKIYADQLASLMKVRGLPDKEIFELKEIFTQSKITTDESLSNLLSKLYPSDKGIGILFYFFNNDTLQRIFFEPGAIIEKKTIPISKDALLQLGYDVNHVVGLFKDSISNLPSKRGVIIETPEKTKGADYASVIKTATTLLLPGNFSEKYKHLLIIPSLNIGTIPFALLQPYNNDSLLIDKCSYTVVPSLVDLLGLRLKMLKLLTKWNGELSAPFNDNPIFNNIEQVNFPIWNALLVANPAYPKNTDYTFPDLPGAKKEIEVAKTYAQNYTLLDGDKAIKDSVIKYLKESDVAYFATHGIADAEKPMENSFLVLSGKDPFLTAKNIMDLRNNKAFEQKFPEMVILSACQTGLGKAMDAGVAGLARSFLLAGSNHVIMSLWNVDDEATAYLMNRFIFHLQTKHSFVPSEPLRLAMLDARNKFNSPAQWASFAVFGIDY